MTHQQSAGLFLTLQWMKFRDVRRLTFLLAVTFALVAAVFVCVRAFTPSAAQQAAADFGIDQSATYADVTLGTLEPHSLRNIRSRLKTAVPDPEVALSSLQVTPDAYTKSFVQTDVPTVDFIENPHLRSQFPGEYDLDSGSWPRESFAVAISSHLAKVLGHPQTFSVLSDTATFRVVGIITDTDAKNSDEIIAGPRTFESLRPLPRGHAYHDTGAQLDVSWPSRGSLSKVAAILAEQLPPLPPGQGSQRNLVKNNYVSRAEIASMAAPGFGSGDIVVSYLPLLLLVMLVSLLAMRQTRSDHKANNRRLIAVGVRPSLTLWTHTVAVSVGAIAGIAVGLASGWLIAVALRATVLPHFAGQPLSPLPGLDWQLGGMAAIALLIVVVGSAWPARRSRANRVPSEAGRRAMFVVAITRGFAAAAVLVVAVERAVHRQSNGDAALAGYLVIVAVMLTSPEILRAALSVLSRTNPRTFVTRRLMSVERGRAAIAIAVIVCSVAVPTYAFTRIDSQKASESAADFGVIPPDQIWVQGDGGVAGLAPVAAIISHLPHVTSPIPVRELHGRHNAYAEFRYRPTSGNFASETLIVDSAQDLRKILDQPLTRHADETLAHGGVLSFVSVARNEQFVIDAANGQQHIVPRSLLTEHLDVAPRFGQHFAGAMLARTARHLGLPLSDPTIYVFTATTSKTIARAVGAVVDANYDANFVQYNVPAPAPSLPTSWYVFFAILIVGGFTVLLVVIRSQARRLRTYSSRLLAIGMAPRWTLSVLLVQSGVTVGIGLLAGIAAGVIGIVIVTDNYVMLDVPAVPILISALAIVAAAGIATSLAVRSLTAVEDPEIN